MDDNSFKLSKASKLWLAFIGLVIVIGLICTYCADQHYKKTHPTTPVVPTEIVDSVHNANK